VKRRHFLGAAAGVVFGLTRGKLPPQTPPPGEWVLIDGRYEYGIIRDSILNATNDYQIFGETFQALAKVEA
jgi:hypothetical protein